VRFIDAFVGQLDLAAAGFIRVAPNEGVVGSPLVASQPYRAYAQKNKRLLTVVNGRVAVRGQQARRGRITMTDRYTKNVLTVIAGALLALIAQNAIHSAVAQSTSATFFTGKKGEGDGLAWTQGSRQAD
jgi:hypothetical protein